MDASKCGEAGFDVTKKEGKRHAAPGSPDGSVQSINVTRGKHPLAKVTLIVVVSYHHLGLHVYGLQSASNTRHPVSAAHSLKQIYKIIIH